MERVKGMRGKGELEGMRDKEKDGKKGEGREKKNVLLGDYYVIIRGLEVKEGKRRERQWRKF